MDAPRPSPQAPNRWSARRALQAHLEPLPRPGPFNRWAAALYGACLLLSGASALHGLEAAGSESGRWGVYFHGALMVYAGLLAIGAYRVRPLPGAASLPRTGRGLVLAHGALGLAANVRMALSVLAPEPVRRAVIDGGGFSDWALLGGLLGVLLGWIPGSALLGSSRAGGLLLLAGLLGTLWLIVLLSL